MPHATFKNTADMVVLALHEGRIHVLLILRAKPPYEGRWALPGGHVDPGEDLRTAARRELKEETGLDTTCRLVVQVGTFGDPGRDPRGQVISTAYVTLFDGPQAVQGADDAKEAKWFDISQLSGDQLAFDHAKIIKAAMTKIQLTYCDVGTSNPRLHLLMRSEAELLGCLVG